MRMMIEPEDKIVGIESRAGLDQTQSGDELPYWIELWDTDAAKVERVLARALSSQLARTIFNTAQNEYPGRRLTLRRGVETLLDSERK
jgi:hypothetical protein